MVTLGTQWQTHVIVRVHLDDRLEYQFMQLIRHELIRFCDSFAIQQPVVCSLGYHRYLGSLGYHGVPKVPPNSA